MLGRAEVEHESAHCRPNELTFRRSSMANAEIFQVTTESEMDEFIDLPWKIYANDTNWVPPLKKAVRKLLDPASHPFLEILRTCALSGQTRLTNSRENCGNIGQQFQFVS